MPPEVGGSTPNGFSGHRIEFCSIPSRVSGKTPIGFNRSRIGPLVVPGATDPDLALACNVQRKLNVPSSG